MEDDDAQNGERKTSGDLFPTTPKTKAGNKTGKTSRTDKKSAKQKKWGLWRYWKSVSRAKQLKWIVEGIGIITAISLLGVYIWDHMQTKWNFEADQRAWIGVSRIDGGIEPDKPTKLILHFINTGKTPAFNVHGAYMMGIGPSIASGPPPPPEGFPYYKEPTIGGFSVATAVPGIGVSG